MTLRSVTSDFDVFGTSMPTTGLPGTGASMRIAGAASASARSLASDVICWTRTRVRDTSSVCVLGVPSLSITTLFSRSRSVTVRVLTSQPGSMPNCVTVGPSLIWTTRASTPKLASVSSMSAARCRLSVVPASTATLSARSSMPGSCHPSRERRLPRASTVTPTSSSSACVSSCGNIVACTGSAGGSASSSSGSATAPEVCAHITESSGTFTEPCGSGRVGKTNSNAVFAA